MTNFMDRMVSPGTWDAGVIVVWVLVAAMIVLLAVLAFRALAGDRRIPIDRSQSRPSSGNDALSALEQRYAKGEIDDEEFERRRAALGRGRR
ncbi:MAG: SHOCT domain-containing protein [Actinomycetota bacterium]|jgi:putative membrane protein|nr:SHOCT domain-containing protein [Actinomycetota bacterium]